MDRAWEVIQKLSPSWCDKPCGVRAGCGCADEIERALNRERDACGDPSSVSLWTEAERDAAIASAVKAERERCAEIADLYVSQARPLGDEDVGECPLTAYSDGQKIVAQNIGHDIRKGLTP